MRDPLGLAIATVLAGLFAFVSSALATYSIAAVDQASQHVGGAITSCVGELDVGIVYGAVPGIGVIHAQAQLDTRSRPKTRALELLRQGLAPSEILAQITQASFDSGYAARQYGIVDVQGRADGFTGAQAQAYKHDQQGRTGTFVFSVQGNILTSQKVLDQAAAAFAVESCDLAERLMRALEAGAQNGEGDSRCTRTGIPSDSAYIQVDRPGESAGSYLRLSVADTGPESPLIALRVMFDAWRATHPCPSVGAAAGSGGAPMQPVSGGAAAAPSPNAKAGSGASAGAANGGTLASPAGGAGAGAAGAAGRADPASAGAGVQAGGGSTASGGTQPSAGGAGLSSSNEATGAGALAASAGSTASSTLGISAAGSGSAGRGARADGPAVAPPTEPPAATSAARGCDCSLAPSEGGSSLRALAGLVAASALYARRRRQSRRGTRPPVR